VTTPIAILYCKLEWRESANGRLAPLPESIRFLRNIPPRLCPLLTDCSILQQWLVELSQVRGTALRSTHPRQPAGLDKTEKGRNK